MLCMVLVPASLTPLAAVGHGTRFGTAGMWYVSSGYVVPLALVSLCVNILWYPFCRKRQIGI